MASVDVMSSPLGSQSNTLFTISSSPGLPSPSELFKKAPLLQTGSRATLPIPSAASATFTCASSLLKASSKASSRDSYSLASNRKLKASSVAEKAPLEEGTTSKPKPQKSRAKNEDKEIKKKKPVQPRRKKAAAEADDANVGKEKVARKSRVKKVEDQTQPKLATARVTKSTSGKGSVAAKGEKLLNLAIDTILEGRPALEAASGAISTDTSGKTASFSKPPSVPSHKDFSNSRYSLGCNADEAPFQQQTPIRVTTKVLGTRKRKSPEISKAKPALSKPEATRKKAKTITDQATAAYAGETVDVEAENDLTKRPGAITDFFTYQPKASENASECKATKTGLKTTKPAKSSKLKPGDRELPILLSPESAIKQCNMQDVVFGTSSQLAREDSPTLIRDLQEAMRASNAVDDDWFESTNDSSKSASTSQRIPSHVRRSKLWAASSRDQSGALLDAEIIDLSISPVTKVNSAPALSAAEDIRMLTELDHDPRDAGGTSILDTRLSDNLSTASPKAVELAKTRATDSSAKDSKPKPATQKPRFSSKKSVSSQRPDYSLYTTIQLTKAVASFGFKAVKRREHMITLLDKCWDSQHGVGRPDEGTSGESAPTMPEPSEKTEPSAASAAAAAIASAQTPPKRPRGRPKKVAETAPSKLASRKGTSSLLPSAAIQVDKQDSNSEDKPLILLRPAQKGRSEPKENLDEISESDTALTPSPSRRKGAKKKMPAVPLKAADSADSVDEKASEAELFSHITKAIRAAPTATSSSKPNWYEKMLLYDPIVLEDLTIWLNTGGLERVNWDGEVRLLAVKKWCESKSVCCLMRETSKGLTRTWR